MSHRVQPVLLEKGGNVRDFLRRLQEATLEDLGVDDGVHYVQPKRSVEKPEWECAIKAIEGVFPCTIEPNMINFRLVVHDTDPHRIPLLYVLAEQLPHIQAVHFGCGGVPLCFYEKVLDQFEWLIRDPKNQELLSKYGLAEDPHDILPHVIFVPR